ncbi:MULTISPECIES: MFS transporter [Staphylococcus]|uniref:MFS transporter n=1 Tax=Staphylococcus TaxID=1279 RepID=UPI0018819149|nr:MFS transporter [Staphylococcus sp. GDY8P57P]MBF2756164.1 MFS transporter [Staphylococcus haemolyticus]MBF2773450.1 MFS transporter [Staphylococcus haemolyticus]MBF2775037.1 MFS transporter [Staphylococcus haemolyticus]MBF2814339.1 MFS transporter [Staphylococcus haemolyticus]MBF9720918.1 MFS transporter [Staphylococcus haemolyticus]
MESNNLSKAKKLFEIAVLMIITVFGIGAQFFSNLVFSLNQGLIQSAFGIGSKYIVYPSIIGNFVFAMGVPLGHTFTHRFGFKRNYIVFVTIFLIGSLVGLISFDIISLTIAKVLQGFSAGVLFFTLLPKLFIKFPVRFRNVFLFMIVIGLFGANALGGLTGGLSLELDKWHWVFIVNVISSVLCLLLGSALFNKKEYTQYEKIPISLPTIVTLMLSTLFILIPSLNLINTSWFSIWVWPFILVAILFIVNFVLWNKEAKKPLLHFRTIFKKKPIVGATMAISSHLALLAGIAGINTYILRILKLPFINILWFYIFFLIGLIITGIIKMFLYNSMGAGILGTIGSIALLYVSAHWILLNNIVNIPLLYLQGLLLGLGASMTLMSGAMATLLDGDLSQAGERSQVMHTIRNFSAAILVPVIVYSMKNNVQKGTQSLYNEDISNPLIYMKKLQDVAIEADHQIFVMMIVFNLVMLIASVFQMFLGKSRRITPPRNINMSN